MCVALGHRRENRDRELLLQTLDENAKQALARSHNLAYAQDGVNPRDAPS